MLKHNQRLKVRPYHGPGYVTEFLLTEMIDGKPYTVGLRFNTQHMDYFTLNPSKAFFDLFHALQKNLSELIDENVPRGISPIRAVYPLWRVLKPPRSKEQRFFC